MHVGISIIQIRSFVLVVLFFPCRFAVCEPGRCRSAIAVCVHMAQRFKGYQTASDFDMRYTDRCPTDSDPSEAPSDDSDNSSAPPRRYRATQKGSRARANKVRTLNRWTTEEHDKLAYLVDKWGSEKNWAKVAEEMPGRTGKQCRERWLNHMKPGIVK